MRRPGVMVLSILLAALLLPVASTSAGKLYSSRQRTRTRCCIPKHNYGHDTPRFHAIGFADARTVVGEGSDQERKPFDFRALKLEIDHLKLEQIGLVIYKSAGNLIATGRITHTNNDDGGLIGSNVTVRIRAFVAAAADANRIPPNAVVVWESKHQLWVSRDRPESISLVPTSKNFPQPEKLTRHFDDITHLELELDYRRDR